VTLSSQPIAETAVVLSGGLSHERDVSLRSGRRVAMALRSRGVEVIESDVDSNLIGLLDSLPQAVVFPVLHGEAGEDGALREVLSLLGVPFVGSVGAACRVAFDKSIATTVVAESGVATPTQIALPHEIFRELGAQALMAALADQIGFPMMVKPSRSVPFAPSFDHKRTKNSACKATSEMRSKTPVGEWYVGIKCIDNNILHAGLHCLTPCF